MRFLLTNMHSILGSVCRRDLAIKVQKWGTVETEKSKHHAKEKELKELKELKALDTRGEL